MKASRVRIETIRIMKVLMVMRVQKPFLFRLSYELPVSKVPANKNLTTDDTDNTDKTRPLIKSVSSVKSVVRFLRSEREHHLKIQAAVGGLRVEHATGQRCKGAERGEPGAGIDRRVQIADGRSGVDVVKQVAGVGAEGQVVTLAGAFPAEHDYHWATRAAWSTASTAFASTTVFNAARAAWTALDLWSILLAIPVAGR